jgi:hypothetical protein
MAAPPLAVGAVHDTPLWAMTALVADTLVGASGTCVILVTEFPEKFAVYTFPAESIATPRGDQPVTPRITEARLDVPGVIFVTLSVRLLAVYTLPAASTTIPYGLVLVPVLAQFLVDATSPPP